MEYLALRDLLSTVVDNRGRTCPTAAKGIPLIATNCVKSSSLYPVFEKVRFVDDETYNSWFRGHPLPNDLIFVLKGSPGQVCIAPDPVNFCIAQDMVALRANPEMVYPSYLFAALRSPTIQSDIANLHVGSLIAHFKKGDFDRLKIPMPCYSAQVEIGDLYMTISEKMEQNSRMFATLEEMARSLYRSWFVDFDPVQAKLEGRDPAHMDPATAALFPDHFGDDGLPGGWKISELGNELEILDSKRIPLSKNQRATRVGNIPYYGATSIMDFVDEALFDEILLLVGEDGSVIKTDGTPFTQYIWGKAWVNNHAHVLKGIRFSVEQLKCIFDQTEISPFVNGAVQAKLNQGNMKKIPYVLASEGIHLIFDQEIAPLFNRIRSLVDENQTLATLRDTLLPKLMSGELRVGEAREQIEELA